MTRDELKTLLRGYRDREREIKQLRQEQAALRSKMTAPGSQRLDGMPRSGGGGTDPLVELIAKLEELESRYNAALLANAAAQLRVEDMLNGLPVRQRTIMRAYYIDGKRWEDVAVDSGLSWRGVHNVHRAALEALLAAENAEQATE